MRRNWLLWAFLWPFFATGQIDLLPRGITPDGPVFDMDRKGSTLYIGGGFNRAGYYTGGGALYGAGSSIPNLDFPNIDGEVHAMIADGNGGWYIGGEFSEVNQQPAANLVHILPNLLIDPNFVVNVNNRVDALALVDDSLFFGGVFTTVNNQPIRYLGAVLLPSGSLSSFNPQLNGPVISLEVLPEGLLAGGSFTRVAGREQPGMALFNPGTGALKRFKSVSLGAVRTFARKGDTLAVAGSFSGQVSFFTGNAAAVSPNSDLPDPLLSAANGTVEAIIPDGSGGWFMAGSFTKIGDSTRNKIAHILPNLSLDPGFQPLVNNTVHGLELVGDTIFFVGAFTQVNGLARGRGAAMYLPTNGLLPWNPQADGVIQSVESMGSRVAIGGSFSRLGTDAQPRLGVVTKSQGLSVPVVGPINGEVKQVLWNNGQLLAGGSFSGTNGLYTSQLARFGSLSQRADAQFPDLNSAVQTVIPDGNGGWFVGGGFTQVMGINQRHLLHISASGEVDTTLSLITNGTVTTLALKNDTLFFGGTFTTVDGQPKGRLAAIKLTTQTLLAWNPDLSGSVESMVILNNTLIVGGTFTLAGSQTRERMASFSLPALSLTAWAPIINGAVNQVAVWNGKVVAMGAFTTVNGSTRQRLAIITPGSGTGTLDNFNLAVNGNVLTGLVVGNNLYLGGIFSQIGGMSRQRLGAVQLNTEIVDPWLANADNQVQTLAILNDTLLVGGSFTTLMGQSRQRLAAIDLGTSTLLAWNPSPNNDVQCLATQGTQVLAGGNFVCMEATTRNYLFALNNSLAIQPLDPNLNSGIEAMAVTGNSLVLGGSFTSIGGQPRERVALWDLAGNQLSAWSGSVNGTVRSLALLGDTIILGGDFTQIGGNNLPRLAMISLNTGQPFPFWKPEPDAAVLSIAVASPQSLAIGGAFTGLQAAPRGRVFLMNTTTQEVLPFAPNVGGFGPRVNGVSWIDDSLFWVVGAFGSVDGQVRQNAALLSTNGQLMPADPAPNDEVFAIAFHEDTILLGGEFNQIGSVATPYTARMNPLTGAITPWKLGADWTPRKFLPQGSNLLVGGEFYMVNSEPRDGVLAIDMLTGAMLPWAPTHGLLVISKLVADPLRNVVYLVGYDGTTQRHVKAFDGSAGIELANFSVTFNGQVNCIKQNTRTGDIYIGGEFTTVNGQPAPYLVVVDTLGQLQPFNGAPNARVMELSWDDSLLYVVGAFDQLNGQVRNKAGAFNLQGDLMDWDPQLDVLLFSQVTVVEAQSDRVYLAGPFGSVRGVARNRVAAVDPALGEALEWDPGITGNSISLVQPISDRVLIGGGYTSINGAPASGLASVGGFSSVIQERFPVDINAAYATAYIDSTLFVGGTFQTLGGKSHPYLAKFTYPVQAEANRLESYFPKEAGNTGDVTLTINAYDIRPGSWVYLRKAGQPDMIPYDSSTVIYANSRLETTFDLRGAPLGEWDIVLNIPGDTTLVIEDGFFILPGSDPEHWADVLAPAVITSRIPTSCYISFGNTGNIDAHGVPIWLAVSENVEVMSIEYEKIEIIDFSDPAFDSIPEFVEVDTILGEPFVGKAYVFVVPKIAAGSSRLIRFVVKGEQSGDYYMRAWAGEPLYGSPLKYYVGECLDDIFSNVIGAVPFAGCLYGILDLMLSPGFDAAYDPNFGSASWGIDYLEALAGTVVGCGLDFTTGGAGRAVAELIDNMLTAKSLGETLEDCFTPEDKDNKGGSFVQSSDPNDKTGLTGQGGLGWLSTQRRFPYMIRFENEPSATAPAKLVIIRDTLDASVFDLNTLELKGFAIADTFFPFPAGRRSMDVNYDLRPFTPALVNVHVALNHATGELVWTLTGLDTATVLPMTDPLAGFLPPNVDTLTGQGSVFFDILPHDTLSTGRTIWNEAAIYFDFNDPIITAPWILTADNHDPESQVDALPDTVFQTPVQVSWSGTDIGSGIRHVDVRMRINGDRWQHAAVNLSYSSFELDVMGGNTYELYTVAYDSALNRETIPLLPDETFFVQQGVKVDPGKLPLSVKVFPNPNSGQFTVEADLPSTMPVTLSLSDLMGRQVMQETRTLPAGLQRWDIRLDLPAGMYLLRYHAGTRTGQEKVQVE